MASNLLSQIAERTSAFLRHSGISQSRLCRHLSICDSSLSQFLSGARGLEPETIIKLCQTLSLSHQEIETKFSKPPAKASKILNLQESTQGAPARMRLDNPGWYPGTDGSGAGVDPYDPTSNGIDNAPDADTAGPAWNQDLIDVLREARGYHRLATKSINAYIAKAKANAGITTPSGVAQKFGRR
jgi:transcriptional regulator with XRE-family HTH domain